MLLTIFWEGLVLLQSPEVFLSECTLRSATVIPVLASDRASAFKTRCVLSLCNFPSFPIIFSYIFTHSYIFWHTIISVTMQWIFSAVFSHLSHSDHSAFAPHPKIKSPRRPTLFNLEVQLPALLSVKTCCLQTLHLWTGNVAVTTRFSLLMSMLMIRLSCACYFVYRLPVGTFWKSTGRRCFNIQQTWRRQPSSDSSAATVSYSVQRTAVSEVGIQEIITNQHPLVLELLKVSHLKYFEQSQRVFEVSISIFCFSQLKYLSVPSVHGLTGRCPFISIHLCRWGFPGCKAHSWEPRACHGASWRIDELGHPWSRFWILPLILLIHLIGLSSLGSGTQARWWNTCGLISWLQLLCVQHALLLSSQLGSIWSLLSKSSRRQNLLGDWLHNILTRGYKCCANIQPFHTPLHQFHGSSQTVLIHTCPSLASTKQISFQLDGAAGKGSHVAQRGRALQCEFDQ